MENFSHIFKIRIKHDFIFDYDDFVNKKEIYVYSEDEEGGEINYWKKYKNTYRLKLEIKTTSDEKFSLPIEPFFGEIEDWVLFKYLAILDYENPFITYKFYSKGEKYGYGESTVVKFENKILKSLFCLESGEKVPIIKYVEEYEKESNQEDLNSLVMTYLERIEIERRDEFDRQEARDTKRSRRNDSYDDSNYNDQLDIDQQGPEFWDSL